MSKSRKKLGRAAIGGLLVLTLVGVVVFARWAFAAASTAQSAMIEITGGGDFVVTSDQVWHFDQDCGAGYFSATGGNATQRTNAKKNFAQQQRCKFWNGAGDLTGGTQGPVTVTVASQPTTPKTCWSLTSQTGGGPIEVCFGADIAGESVVVNNQWPASCGGKKSFTLLNPDGSSRITNLQVELSGTASVPITAVGHTIVPGSSDNGCWLEFPYTGNAGVNGTAQSSLVDDTMGNVLTTDCFSRNDNGCPYTAVAHMDQVCFTLGPGIYTVTITGTIKGVDGNASLTFTGEAVVNISAEGCE